MSVKPAIPEADERGPIPRSSKDGTPLAAGHVFDDNMECHGCGVSYTTHRRTPRWCPTPIDTRTKFNGAPARDGELSL